jgi:hypothetical protein
MRPFIGHHKMTPDIERRVEDLQAWVEGKGEHPWFARIDYILVDREIKLPLLDRGEWRAIYENPRLVLLERERPS